MIISTTNQLDGYRVTEYIGIASGEAIMGANIARDFLSGITDIIGGRSSAYESKLAEGRKIALEEMEEEAERLGADAVIGVQIDFETIKDGMMMVIASGTAVRTTRV
ncbi:YbjQ family protein [Bacillaceae bacterium SIJ1]|uniref:YbjQ family protein n=1 Tax=Litoribacterium kuwaitense TaxID=1398745 RepID=UPI0013E9F5FA|nr:YbjQ family protein [Litoribacterium kuwaitense]NGP46041.1 YbjQ family protein [Litoribacterium kuwaitense]